MNNIIRKLPLLVPVLMLIYGSGAYCGLWDSLSGRTNALKSFNLLSSTKGTPDIFIKNTEEEFKDLYDFMIDYLQEPTIKELHKQGILPEYIIRGGGAMGSELQKQMPPNFRDVTFVPETLPIFFGYKNPLDEKNDRGYDACSLGDLRRWIEESRNSERFIVSTLLLGFLSLIVAIIEIRNERPGT